LLLRASLGVATIIQGFLYLRGADPSFAGWMGGLLAVAVGVSLLLGFVTPLAGFLTGLGAAGLALSWFQLSTPNLFEARLSKVFAIVITMALGCLGPGAYSIDAFLFGRREIIVPRPRRSGNL
jgi:uncharacterized membrane protein YkgB